jgi:uncharacterized membrane protein HdeD (DUF308 family)
MTTLTQPVESEMPSSALGHRWGSLLVLGIVQIIAGSIAIAIPVIASLAAVGMFGAVLIVSAVFQIIHAFRLKQWPRSAWYGLGGLLYAIAGLLVLMYPLNGAFALAVMIATLFIAEGALRLLFAVNVRPISGWGWVAAAGICSIIVGVILLIGLPATALWVTGLLLGVNLIFTGATYAAIALACRTTNRAKPAAV